MSIRNDLKKVLYFTVGAVATGIEVLADAADGLVEKGASVVKDGKAVFDDFCQKCSIPDDEDPAVIIVTDESQAEDA